MFSETLYIYHSNLFLSEHQTYVAWVGEHTVGPGFTVGLAAGAPQSLPHGFVQVLLHFGSIRNQFPGAVNCDGPLRRDKIGPRVRHDMKLQNHAEGKLQPDICYPNS